MGLERNENDLLEARGHISFWFDAARRLAPSEPRAWELINMLTVASIATEAAIQRKESRGVHFRTDYLETSEPMHSIMTPNVIDACTVEGTCESIAVSRSMV
jgi:L-aspartate oxidase